MNTLQSSCSYIFLILVLCCGCKTKNQNVPQNQYSRQVGDIVFDSLLDDTNFKVCNGDEHIAQYFHKEKSYDFDGDKPRLEQIFKDEFHPTEKEDQNGWVRIRFIVNCEGKTGRFRILEADFAYQEFKFDKTITEQLLEISKNLAGWKPNLHEDHTHDYYQYLIFKLENGKLAEILP